jgi:hypothetical protein
LPGNAVLLRKTRIEVFELGHNSAGQAAGKARQFYQWGLADGFNG